MTICNVYPAVTLVALPLAILVPVGLLIYGWGIVRKAAAYYWRRPRVFVPGA